MICCVHVRGVAGLLAFVFATQVHAQQVLLSAHGAAPLDYLGAAVAVGPDLDGDGFAEIAVGASGLHKGASPLGGALILSGRDFGVIRTLYGKQNNEAAGLALAWCGDLDGDGVDDLAVGAPIHWVVGGAGREAGLVRIHSGATGAVIREIPGATTGGRFGWSLANLGDVNGDGSDDLLVGTPSDPTNGAQSGAVSICSGADGSTLQTLLGAAGSEFGWSVANVGDLDGDGVNDFAAGAPYADGANPGDAAGSVFVHSGATGALLLQFDGGDAKCPTYSGGYTFSGDRLGVATGSAGDFDRDGVPDVWVASYWSAGSGVTCQGPAYITVHSGATGATLLRIDSTGGGQICASAIGDVDGDGRTDFVAGYDYTGWVFVYSSLGGKVIWETDAPRSSSVGSAVAPVGDFDGDGRPDLLVGADLDDVGGTNTGTIELITTSDLWLDVAPTHFPSASWRLDLRANLGPPGNPAVLVLTAVNGAPRFDVVAVANFDAAGSAPLASGKVPTGFSGTTLALRAFAIDAAGRVVDSSDEVLTLQ